MLKVSDGKQSGDSVNPECERRHSRRAEKIEFNLTQSNPTGGATRAGRVPRVLYKIGQSELVTGQRGSNERSHFWQIFPLDLVAGHMPTHNRNISTRARRLVYEFTVEHDDNCVR